MPTDYYELLECERNATGDEIKKAYRRLARTLHPDASGGDPVAEARFKEITLAYETLRDPERRRRYDMFGPDAERGAGAPRGFDGTVFGGGFGDIFETFFGQTAGFGGRAGRQSRVPDAEIAIELSFEQSVFGAEIEVPLELPVVCTTCGGSGSRPGTTPVSCTECAGTGQVRRVRQSLLGQMMTAMPCGRCDGTGEYVSSPCADCRGNGQRQESRTITVQVPAGVDNGSVLRVAGQGPAGHHGRGTGDLYVHLRVAPHNRFERAGNNLLMSLHIQMTHAALGAEVEIESLDGAELITIPPGTQTGKVIHLKGKGVPDLHGGRRRGDLLINVVVDTPTRLSRHEEDVLRQFAELRGDDVAKAEGGLLSRLPRPLIISQSAQLDTRRRAAAQVFVDDLAAPELSVDDARHLAAALRLRQGERVVAADGAGTWRICEVGIDFGRSGRRAADHVLLTPAGPVVNEERSQPALTVAFALPKGDRPEAIVRGLVETGVDRIVPLVTERTVVRPELAGTGGSERLDRFRRVAREAAMQSRRVFLPDIAEITPFADFLAGPPESAPAALCVPDGAPPSLAYPVVVIGPEGGFSDAELALGLPEIGLGPSILRSETAAVVAGALLVALRAGIVVSAPTGTRLSIETSTKARADSPPGEGPG